MSRISSRHGQVDAAGRTTRSWGSDLGSAAAPALQTDGGSQDGRFRKKYARRVAFALWGVGKVAVGAARSQTSLSGCDLHGPNSDPGIAGCYSATLRWSGGAWPFILGSCYYAFRFRGHVGWQTTTYFCVVAYGDDGGWK